MNALIQDIRYAIRMLCKSPGFAAVAILTLALGIGANTAIFSLMNAVMLRELPVAHPNQLVLFGDARQGGSDDAFANTRIYSYPFYRELRARNQSFSEVSAALSVPFDGTHGAIDNSANLETINAQLVSGTYFSMLGVKPVLGRTFTAAEDAPAGAHAVAVISDSWWKRRFNRDPGVVGKTITFRARVYTIIGVAPPGFFGTTVGQSPDVWLPLSMEAQISPGWNGLDDQTFQSLYVFARLKPGVTPTQAQAEVNTLAQQLWRAQAGASLTHEQQERLQRASIELTSAARGISRLRSRFTFPLEVLMVVVALVLLIACANIANLLLARATTRQREIAVRMAIGAGRSRLVQQMLTENLLLALIGGALGIWFASWTSGALLAMVSGGTEPLPLNVAPDARILAFTLLVCVATVLLFGIAPALRATRVELTGALKEGKGSDAAGGRRAMANALIVSQVALSLVLLIGAGLFLRSISNLENVPTGFNKENVLLFGVDPNAVGYKEDARLVNLYQALEQRIATEPGVRSASVSFFTFNEGEWDDPVTVFGSSPAPGIENDVIENVVGQGYFSTMGIPLLAGRTFGPQDTATSPKVAVINETMARNYFPGISPIGRRFALPHDVSAAKEGNNDAGIEVVGVVKDAKYISLREQPQAAAYYPYTQGTQFYYDLEVRYSGNARPIVNEVRQAASEIDPRLPVAYQSTLSEKVDESIAGQSLVSTLSAFFGLLAAFLACIGIYGVMSYAVSRRTREIGIRMAIGAERSDVLRMVMGEVGKLVTIGLAIGIPAALAADRWATSLLFGLKPTDPLTLASATVLLLLVALFAGYLPARRATKVDPMIALRYE
jgi:predicted permease